MTSIDIKELSPRNRALRARRLRQLQRSLERHDYQVDSSLVAGDMIREASTFLAARRLQD